MGRNLNFLKVLLLTVAVVGIPLTKLGIISLVRGLSPEKCLSSDAEAWVYNTYQEQNQTEVGTESEFQQSIKNSYVRLFSKAITITSQIFGLTIFATSISMSCLVSITFGLLSFKISRLYLPFNFSVIFCAICLFETHVLGGTTLGCNPLGLLPRELAQCIAVGIMLYRLKVIDKNLKTSSLNLGIIYTSVAVLFYIYPPQGLGLFLIIASFDVYIYSKLSSLKEILLPLLIFFCIIYPLAVSFAIGHKSSNNLNLEILKQRNSFMMITGFDLNTLLYLRRFVVQTIALIVIGFFIYKKNQALNPKEKNIIFPLTVISFLYSIFGILIEQNPKYLTFFISRASIFYTFFFYLIFLIFLQKIQLKSALLKNISLVLLILFMILNTNLVGFIRQVCVENLRKKETQSFFRIIDYFKCKKFEKSLFIVEYSNSFDLAATFRTYSKKTVYVCDKEGGISLVDGKKAKIWADKVINQQLIFSEQNIERKIARAKDIKANYLIIKNRKESVYQNPLIKDQYFLVYDLK